MKHKNIIVIPPYYSGTSFEDIASALFVAVKKLNLRIKFIGYNQPLNSVFTSEQVLDDKQYIYGQLDLLKKLMKFRNNAHRILFLDFFNPGLDLFKYSITQQDTNVTMASLLHGGSFVPGDLYSNDWIKNFENGWFSLNNKVYASSKYLRKKCPTMFKSKVRVLPWGMDAFEATISNNKKWDVIFPHRLQSDKGVVDFLKIVKAVPDINFLVTSPLKRQQLSKNKFFSQLNNVSNIKLKYNINNKNIVNFLSVAKIVLSCSSQETFGYSIMKSVACGCIPVVPNRTCYPEYFDRNFRYKNLEEAIKMIRGILLSESDADLKLDNTRKKILNFSFVPLLKDFFE